MSNTKLNSSEHRRIIFNGGKYILAKIPYFFPHLFLISSSFSDINNNNVQIRLVILVHTINMELLQLRELKRSPRLPWVYKDATQKNTRQCLVIDMRYSPPGNMTCTCRTPSGEMTDVLLKNDENRWAGSPEDG